MIAGEDYDGVKVDCWSCGIILYALICGFLPFEDPDTAELYKKILKGFYQVPVFVSDDAEDLIANLLVHKPKNRFDPDLIVQHSWFHS